MKNVMRDGALIQPARLKQLRVLKARSFRSRLLGLHGIPLHDRQDTVLWLPGCRAVHSFFLTSVHTVVFLDEQYHLLKGQQLMRSYGYYYRRRATHVVELPAEFHTYSVDVLQAAITSLLKRARNI